jgi:hypothetical protein
MLALPEGGSEGGGVGFDHGLDGGVDDTKCHVSPEVAANV